MSEYQVHQVKTLNRGAAQCLVLYLALRSRGLRFPWLGVIAYGMVTAARCLLITMLLQTGQMKAWKS